MKKMKSTDGNPTKAKFHNEFFIETTRESSWESNEDRQISSKRSRKIHAMEARWTNEKMKENLSSRSTERYCVCSSKVASTKIIDDCRTLRWENRELVSRFGSEMCGIDAWLNNRKIEKTSIEWKKQTDRLTSKWNKTETLEWRTIIRSKNLSQFTIIITLTATQSLHSKLVSNCLLEFFSVCLSIWCT
jgi:hypothetical protein